MLNELVKYSKYWKLVCRFSVLGVCLFLIMEPIYIFKFNEYIKSVIPFDEYVLIALVLLVLVVADLFLSKRESK